MLCCSSCGLPVQGHQLPMGPQCTILSDKGSHTSSFEPECTMYAQAWSGHPKGKQINKECKFQWQQVPGTLPLMRLTHRGTMMSRLNFCTSCRKTTPSRPSSISSLSWSVSCSCSNLLQLRLHSRLLMQKTLILSYSQLRSSSPVFKCPCSAFPLLLGLSPERLLQRTIK